MGTHPLVPEGTGREAMKFFFPDSHDLVDPSFDFETEERSPTRIRHQHDLYAHEVFSSPPYDGILLSKAIVDGTSQGAGKYTAPQRLRLFRSGIRPFFRLTGTRIETMGDCGAFAYVREPTPPYTVDEVLDFYDKCGFDHGVSVDHVILGFALDCNEARLPREDLEGYKHRQEITLSMAMEFLKRYRKNRLRFTPMGVAQGWSPRSYAESITALQKMGYTRIGIGGLVPLKTDEILAVLSAVSLTRKSGTALHLFGVTRIDSLAAFQKAGVTSFDSTSPLLHAFKHDSKNYFSVKDEYAAVRIPQVEGNAKLAMRIRAGEIKQERARRLEKSCLSSVYSYARNGRGLKTLLATLQEYNALFDGRKDRTDMYSRTLQETPWNRCKCDVCRSIGINVVLFRGAERNRRRGFHNLYVIHNRLRKRLVATA
jgi:hypothetical protein